MMPGRAGKALYALLFVVLLPAGLALWARATARLVPAPAVRSVPVGLALLIAGCALVVWGMASLWRYGHGLPMNAFPPAEFVSEGAFRFFPHPIYLGFSIACAGVAIAAASASGLWLVTPTVILGSIALVAGYELPDLKRRFGQRQGASWIVPPDSDATPSIADRFRCCATVLLPWLVTYEAFVVLGPPRDAVSSYLSFEYRWPVLAWTVPIYVGAYPFTVGAPFVARRLSDLRRFALSGFASMATVFSLFIALPLVAAQRPFTPYGTLGRLLALDDRFDGPNAAFPSYHVVWAFIAANAYVSRVSRLRWLWRLCPVLIAVSCLTTGKHSVADVIAGAILALLVTRPEALWDTLRRRAEALANSWREWRAGPLRIINHGAYAATGVTAGIWLVDTLLGPGADRMLLAICITSIAGAAIWAQWVEGSPRLLRPLGFYGGLLGVCCGALFAPLFGFSSWLVLGAFCVAAPWIQGIGRLRCLVQGCCHGAPTKPGVGIRYTDPRSRVCRIASLCGVPIHATQLYSILFNAFIAIIVGRLWLLHVPIALVCGVYLICMGAARFIEEGYRGEPQTKVVLGLRLYQWMAIASVASGAVISAAGARSPAPSPMFHVTSVWIALLCGALAWLISGVDFPGLDRRFARLT